MGEIERQKLLNPKLICIKPEFGLSAKNRGSAKNRQRWTESNTLSFKENVNMPFEDKENVNMPFEDTRLVADT